jgi:hypothetical protein
MRKTRPSVPHECARSPGITGVVISMLVLGFFLSINPPLAQQSSSFRLNRLSITALADASTSATYRSVVTAQVVSGSTGVCPAGMTSTLGFWSLRGGREVPIVLTLGKDDQNPPHLVLAWSGQADGFAVYRDTSPADVVNPANVLSTTDSCAETDTTAESSNLFFYRVSPTP